MAAAQTKTIAVCAQGISSYWREVERGAIDRLRRERTVKWSWLTNLAAQGPFDWLAGLVIRLSDPRLEEQLVKAKVPAVNVSSYRPMNLPRAGVDDAAAGRMAADTFATLLGTRYGAYITPDESMYGELRNEGFVAEGVSRGMVIEALSAGARFDASLRELLKRTGGKMVGLFAYNDDVAVRALEHCLALGVAVPEQVSIIGVGNVDEAQIHSPRPFSSIELPAYGVGATASEMVLEMIANPRKRPADQLLPPLRVIHRDTTGHRTIEDPVVRAAIAFIQRAEENVMVSDVVEHVGQGTRRTLERRFREVLGRGIGEQLVRSRLSRAKALLLSSTLSIKQVAYHCGFSSPQKFSTVFRHYEGYTPQQFRRRAGVEGTY